MIFKNIGLRTRVPDCDIIHHHYFAIMQINLKTKNETKKYNFNHYNMLSNLYE